MTFDNEQVTPRTRVRTSSYGEGIESHDVTVGGVPERAVGSHHDRLVRGESS
jgi:hypothetical protein